MKYLLIILSLWFLPQIVKADNRLIAFQETDFLFRGKNSNRAHNIQLATSLINQRTIQPGEIFSFNDTVGPRTSFRGFRKAKTIVLGNLEERWGGGVCQVAGTFHAAIFQAGLEIIESRQHSRLSQYLSAGLDTTVVYGYKDFRFRNNFNSLIVIKLFLVHPGRLRAEVWSTETPVVKIDIMLLASQFFSTRIIYTCENLRIGQRDVWDQGAPYTLIRRRRYVNGIWDERIIRYNLANRIIRICR